VVGSIGEYEKMKDFKVGSLVRRKSYRGVLNSLHSPSYYGVIVRDDGGGKYEVAFILKGGTIKRKNVLDKQLALVY
jgi:hypothetical protein